VNTPSHISGLELAAPFLYTIVVLLVTVVGIHEIRVRLEQHFERGWTKSQLEKVPPDRAPATHALAVLWAIDTSQIATTVGAPLGALVILRKVYTSTFLIPYTLVLALGLIMFFYNLRQVKIGKLHGFELLGYRITPVTIAAIILNAIGALVAAFVIH
jgi:uncharacterized membrane protein